MLRDRSEFIASRFHIGAGQGWLWGVVGIDAALTDKLPGWNRRKIFNFASFVAACSRCDALRLLLSTLRENSLSSLSMFKRLVVGVVGGLAVAASMAPVGAAERPVRWNTGAAVWSTDQAAFNTFLETGSITDRGLEGGLNRSGWTSEEVRQGMLKTYNVDFLGVARFMYSDAGVKFLKNQTTSYFPYWGMTSTAVPALRSAIIADAVDGQISGAGIMAKLPTDMRLADTCNTYSGSQNVCAQGRCNPSNGQCTSLLSWYVFLPQCIQQNQAAVAAVPAGSAAPAPQGAVRGLW